jgi:hypothetical protein
MTVLVARVTSRSRAGNPPPEACPLCGEEKYQTLNWSGAEIRHFGCGIIFDRRAGTVSFFPKYLDGIRDVASEHFRRQLGEQYDFVASGPTW